MRCSRAILCVFFVYLRLPLWLALLDAKRGTGQTLFQLITIAQSQQFSKSARRKLACPYSSMPVSRLEKMVLGLHPARLPLGGGWCGQCTAPGHEGEIPSQAVLEAFSATSDMPAVVTGRRRSVSGTPCDSPSAPPESSPYAPIRPAPLLFRLASCFCTVCLANGATGPSSTATLNSTCPGQLGSKAASRTYAFRRWRECFLESYLKKKA